MGVLRSTVGGLIGASLRTLQVAAGTALLAGDTVIGAGRTVAGTVADLAADVATGAESTARTTLGLVVEALGGPPARRTSRNDSRHWIEVCGLSGPDADAIAEEVVSALRAVPGVTDVAINHSMARAVVTVETGIPAADLTAVVAEAERRARTTEAGRHRPHTLPWDDALLAARAVGAAAAAVGLGLSVTGNVLRFRGLPDFLSAIPTLADHNPGIHRQFERRLGREGTDLLFSLLTSASAAMTVSPTSAAAEMATRTMMVVEAVHTRRAWRRHEPRLVRHRPSSRRPHRGTLEFGAGAGERYADRAVRMGVTAAAVVGAVSRNPTIGGAAALVTAPKPSRAAREAFGCAMTQGLITHHDALVVRPRALRALDRVDAVVIDPRVLYTDQLAVTRIVGVTNSDRDRAWRAVQRALDRGGLTPGWHPLSSIAGAPASGRILISPVRDQFAAAVVTEAHRCGRRVLSLDDDGLRSLARGFDKLYPLGDSVDESLAAAVAEAKADGATVALFTSPAMTAPHAADITIGLSPDGHPPPWGADVFVPDLVSMWRILRALPAARSATTKGVRLSASSTAIGALMLIPGVTGNGPESVNVGVAAGLWSGFRTATKVFDDSPPEPEPSHDWHALPADEVRRLLPRRGDGDRQPPAGRDPALMRPVRAAAAAMTWFWQLTRDFTAEMRSNLADPITPLLATGAVASALLGSPLDAALVGGVLLLNAALAAQQQLHAERILRRLMAVQEPSARRRVRMAPATGTGATGTEAAPVEAGPIEEVPANRLRPGDVIEVRVGDVVPADARIMAASNVEVDESSLTGESLPVPKTAAATPGAPLAERSGMLYAGTTMVAGTAVAVVTAVGPRTEVRRALAMAAERPGEIGLQRQLAHITKRALPFSVSSGALVGLLSVLRGTPIRAAVGSAVSLIVAAVPEGLPLVATLAQLASARRLSGESILIRNPNSIEALARLQVVCFDKTGTLSENRLQVKAVHPMRGRTETEVLEAALSTTFAEPGHRAHHATDEAIIRAVNGAAIAAPAQRDGFLPFQAGRPYAAAVRGTRLTIKGAPEVLASALARGDSALTRRVEAMAAQGLRVLAVAGRELSPEQAAAAVADPAVFTELCGSGLSLFGLIGLADTPRPSARGVLADLTERGIGVRLITGDHPVTAAVTARELGLDVDGEQVITGAEWETLSAEERAAAVRSRSVFARMSPEHKIDVVQTLERNGVVTAMVGDGANDAAAIRAASVGVGVATRSSDPARTAADIVLLDGRIEALIDALDEGHHLWRRVQSAVSMLLGGNAGEIAFALLTSLLTGRSVLNARQMLLVNMLTDAMPAAALAVSTQAAPGAIRRDRAAQDESTMWRAIAVRGAATTLGAGLAWTMARMTGTGARASTVALIGLVSTQLAQTLSDSRDRLVVLTALGSFAVLAGVVSTPGVSQVFGCRPVGPVGWGQAFLATAVAATAAALAPGVLQRIAGTGRSVLVDDDDAGLDQDGVERPQRRGQQPNAGGDQGVGAGNAGVVSHTSRLSNDPDESGVT